MSVEVQTFSTAQVRLMLVALFVSAMTIGVTIGGMVPLIAVSLETRGVDTILIGINSAMTSLGVLAVAPFTTQIVRRVGAGDSMVYGLALTAACVLAMGYADAIWVWLLLRFLIGCGVALHWVVSETWMHAVVTEERRGLVMSTYVTSIAAGFAVGPLILTTVGTEGVLPFATFAGLVVLTALPLVLIRKMEPSLSLKTGGNVITLARQAPTIFAAVMAIGLVDAAFFTFLPLYGIRVGYEEAVAITLLTAVFAGNLFLQIPFGWLADKVNRRGLLITLGVVSIAGPALAAFALATDLWLTYAVLFVWGGASFGIYTVSITMLGERYKGGELAAANAAFVMTFEIANMAGPPIVGVSMNLWEPHGLMVYMTVIAVGFVVIALYRGVARKG